MSTLTLRFALLAVVACSRTPDAVDSPPAPAATAATEATATAAYDAKQWTACEQQWLAVAAATKDAPHVDALYNAACCYAQDGKPDPAFANLAASIAAGFRELDAFGKDHDLVSLHDDPRWATEVAAIGRNIAAWEKTLSDPALRRELLAMTDEDQAARFAWNAGYRAGRTPDWAPVAAIDKKTSAAMHAVLASHGWPGKSAVGDDGAHAAWLLVQHADLDRPLQRDVLAQMKPMVATGEVAEADYAYLYDRVAVAEGRPQRYGTQFKDGEPSPIEDAANVDARRAAIGLGTMAEYRKNQEKMYGPPKADPVVPGASPR